MPSCGVRRGGENSDYLMWTPIINVKWTDRFFSGSKMCSNNWKVMLLLFHIKPRSNESKNDFFHISISQERKNLLYKLYRNQQDPKALPKDSSLCAEIRPASRDYSHPFLRWLSPLKLVTVCGGNNNKFNHHSLQNFPNIPVNIPMQSKSFWSRNPLLSISEGGKYDEKFFYLSFRILVEQWCWKERENYIRV